VFLERLGRSVRQFRQLYSVGVLTITLVLIGQNLSEPHDLLGRNRVISEGRVVTDQELFATNLTPECTQMFGLGFDLS